MIPCHLNLAEHAAAAKRGQAHMDADLPKVAGKNEQPKGGKISDMGQWKLRPCANQGSQAVLAVCPSQPAL